MRIQDVAAAAGVSVATVSNALNRPERVNAGTAARIQRIARELDYVPHHGAVDLRHGRRSAIALVIPDVTNSFYARITRGAADAAYGHGFSLVLCDSNDDAERERDFFTMLADQRAAGAVVVPRGADRQRLDGLRRRGIPLVLTDRAVPVQEGCSVAVDDVAGGRLAVEHLLAGGARRILVVNGDRAIRQCADRWQGARQAVREHRGAAVRQVSVPQMDVACGAAAVRELAELPDAVFCTNDFLAVGVVQALLARGVRVPGDITVAGFGDLDVATVSAVPLTTVRQPVEELGRAGVGLLLDEVEAVDDHTHEARQFPPRLVVRESAPRQEVLV
ncbi:LacI family DNA-binding transcriptional regulator [Paractinoplanes deccanensis]|uniref:LacI family DNA-binding transcriptional regulator n=1 Tax=Paractinoplanes deccanensis TaxID=113561 RepID=UPI00194158C0|nr:substrate-binding domain-containing protein [Actinoplanes deccanensis]